jgi:hypothetical protein
MSKVCMSRELVEHPVITLVPNQLPDELLVTSKGQDHNLGFL